MARFAVLAAAVALAACQPPKPTLDPEAQPIAHAFFDEVRSGDDFMADTHVAHELKTPTSIDQIAQFRTLIPDGPPASVTLQRWNAKVDSTGATTTIAEIYDYGDRKLLVQTAFFKSPAGQDPVIVGFKVEDGGG